MKETQQARLMGSELQIGSPLVPDLCLLKDCLLGRHKPNIPGHSPSARLPKLIYFPNTSWRQNLALILLKYGDQFLLEGMCWSRASYGKLETEK
jgi:hypothetical protein